MALATFGTLAGKGVVVTGAAAGIGRATALYLAGEGVRVVVSDIDADAGKSLVEEIRGSGGAAEFVACDISSESDVESLIERSVSFLGGRITSHSYMKMKTIPVCLGVLAYRTEDGALRTNEDRVRRQGRQRQDLADRLTEQPYRAR